ncbi:MAG: hypothetical protein RMX68_016665 [Aulosira sp. ZfuVER01]|nr:hypothetical protein [Aulosira sp. ZfuVER01]MDZ8000829.1 hypothetical protein [Aulosira sp. DedVER01a]MDZ8055900.1 hypothetical protein [Aulosira sp. ZfuCHP01]
MAPEESYMEYLQKEHREKPLEFFTKLLTDIRMGRSEEEAIREWKRLCEQVSWYAEDAIRCLETILADPPANLIEIMQENGWILLDHGSQSYTPIKAYRQQYVEWLEKWVNQCRDVYFTYHPPVRSPID